MSQANVSNARKLAEAAVMLAVATVLSLIKFIDLPYGGSVTVACMLPVVIISYRHGIKFGLLTGFVFGLIQQLLSLNTLSYVTTWQSIIAVIILDYIIAFMLIGLGGMFKKLSSQANALLLGTIVVCILRYICHVISGATVWAGLSIPTNAALIYSIGYNATYMIPEAIITAAVAYYVGSIIDFRNDTITNIKKSEKQKLPVLKWIGGLLLASALIVDVRSIFMHLQNEESGEFDFTGFANVNWSVILIVSVTAIVIAAILFIVSSKKTEE
ncbi:MAG: energy-coupled thiamine transporter ThiT [Lachnospiraceae bacterium]|nr:energy-coupled thiamine transporter ThiT [Lachnospiraceae bacterium]